eukprot:6102867-Prymnesium_polylepis.1
MHPVATRIARILQQFTPWHPPILPWLTSVRSLGWCIYSRAPGPDHCGRSGAQRHATWCGASVGTGASGFDAFAAHAIEHISVMRSVTSKMAAAPARACACVWSASIQKPLFLC